MKVGVGRILLLVLTLALVVGGLLFVRLRGPVAARQPPNAHGSSPSPPAVQDQKTTGAAVGGTAMVGDKLFAPAPQADRTEADPGVTVGQKTPAGSQNVKSGQEGRVVQPGGRTDPPEKPPDKAARVEPPGVSRLKDRFDKVLPALLNGAGRNSTLDYQVFWRRFTDWLDQQEDVPTSVRTEFGEAFAVELGLRVE